MKLKRLGAADFERLARGADLDAGAQRLARRVLVEGLAPTTVSVLEGASRQRIGGAVAAIQKRYTALGAAGFVDAAWVAADLMLPHQLALRIDETCRALCATGDPALRLRAIDVILAALAEAGQLAGGVVRPQPVCPAAAPGETEDR